MNILFIGGAYSENQIEKFRVNSKRGFSYSAQTFQEACLKGLELNNVSYNVISNPYLSTFPFGYKCPIIISSNFIFNGREKGISLGSINVPFLKSPSFRKALKYADSWYNGCAGMKIVVTYNMSKFQMSLALKLKQQYPDIKLICIIADLPIHTRYNTIYSLLGLKEKTIKYLMNNVAKFDGFVLLTEPMKDIIKIAHKPYVVMEGMYQEKEEKLIRNKSDKKVVFYSGALVGMYGVNDLLDAFMKIDDENYELHLCGDGDSVPRILEMTKTNKRIKYFGVLPNEETRQLQRDATLLVNPRHSSEEFTAFSFPSKTLEYLASGTPTLMAPLKCLPAEYKEYLYFFEDESVEGMSKKIVEVCNISPLALEERGKMARKFVLSEKNAKNQMKRICDFIVNNFS